MVYAQMPSIKKGPKIVIRNCGSEANVSGEMQADRTIFV